MPERIPPPESAVPPDEVASGRRVPDSYFERLERLRGIASHDWRDYYDAVREVSNFEERG